LAGEPIAGLTGRRLEAEDFDKLAVGDSVRDLLLWLGDAQGYKERCEGAKWATFCNVCKNEYRFDPEQELPSKVGDLLLTGGGAWDKVWNRFREAPSVYAGVAQVLRNATSQDLTSDPSRQPGLNAEQEDQLRAALGQISDLPHEKACVRVLALEAQHAERRGWVWAQLGESPLALLLEPLARLAECAQAPLSGTNLKKLCEAYATEGWRCDEAALDVMAAAGTADTQLVHAVLQAVYVPWLDQAARTFQSAATKDSKEFRAAATSVRAESETCIVFADGLRFDVAEKLLALLEARGCTVAMSHRLAPVPSVTATAKPVASPANEACEESEEYGELAPLLDEKPGNAKRLRDAMARQGIAVLEATESAFPLDATQGGWTEFGNLDKHGHSMGLELAKLVQGEVEALAGRVTELLEAGWSQVRVVTDHGWLLVPGNLPKVELPTFLTETKWARCAVSQGKVPDGMPNFPWHWNAHVQVVSPPGIGSFFAGNTYAHGGVSPQECVVPELTIRRGAAAVRAKITEVSWRGMRCRVSVESSVPGLLVDLRLKPKQADSSIVSAPKATDAKGQAGLVVEDDNHEGAAAMVVVLNAAGQVLDQTSTEVGDES
jgi:hypothetical protein